jgi:hypothetical protein
VFNEDNEEKIDLIDQSGSSLSMTSDQYIILVKNNVNFNYFELERTYGPCENIDKEKVTISNEGNEEEQNRINWIITSGDR